MGAEVMGYWAAFDGLFSLVSVITALFLLQYCLGFSDTALILVGAGSRLAFVVILGFTQSDWMAFLATAVGSLRRIDQYAITAFVSKLV